MCKVLGYCKECFHELTTEHEIENDNVYECPECYYPNLIADMHNPQVTLDYNTR